MKPEFKLTRNAALKRRSSAVRLSELLQKRQ
jgi:hypothetical protein